MQLFHPAQLAWIVLASVVVLYFLVRRRAVDVSSHLLWQRVAQQQNVWRRAQRWISAALMVLLLAILAVVLAEPYWRSQRDAARTIVVVLETGQETAEEGWQAARRSALTLVDGMELYEKMAVVVGGGPAHVICPLTDDRVKLRKAIEAAKPVARQEPRVSATDLARWMIAAEPNPTVIRIELVRRIPHLTFTTYKPAASGPGADSSWNAMTILLTDNEKKDTSVAKGGIAIASSNPPGMWLLVAALAVCCGEWLLFSRRVTV